MPDSDVVDGAILSNAADHLHAVFRAPGHPANTNPARTIPATTLSNADPAGDLSGDGWTSGALLHGDCLDVMARRSDPDSKNPRRGLRGLKFYRVQPVPETSPGNPH